MAAGAGVRCLRAASSPRCRTSATGSTSPITAPHSSASTSAGGSASTSFTPPAAWPSRWPSVRRCRPGLAVHRAAARRLAAGGKPAAGRHPRAGCARVGRSPCRDAAPRPRRRDICSRRRTVTVVSGGARARPQMRCSPAGLRSGWPRAGRQPRGRRPWRAPACSPTWSTTRRRPRTPARWSARCSPPGPPVCRPTVSGVGIFVALLERDDPARRLGWRSGQPHSVRDARAACGRRAPPAAPFAGWPPSRIATAGSASVRPAARATSTTPERCCKRWGRARRRRAGGPLPRAPAER